MTALQEPMSDTGEQSFAPLPVDLEPVDMDEVEAVLDSIEADLARTEAVPAGPDLVEGWGTTALKARGEGRHRRRGWGWKWWHRAQHAAPDDPGEVS